MSQNETILNTERIAMTNRGSVGRPRLPDSTRLSEPVPVRLFARQLLGIADAEKAQEITRSDFIRRAVDNELKRLRKRDVIPAKDRIHNV